MSFRMAIVLVAGILGDLVFASPLTRSPSTPLARSAIVDLGYSRYQGVALGNGVDEYLGLRYAKPPLNELRFRGPEDPEQTDGVVDATAVSSQQLTVAPAELTGSSLDPSVLAWVNEPVTLWERTACSSISGVRPMQRQTPTSRCGCSSREVGTQTMRTSTSMVVRS